MFSVLHWLFPEDFPDQKSFVQEYCSDSHGLLKLQYELSRRMITRFKEEVLYLPGTVNLREEIDMSASQGRRYKKMERNFVDWLRDRGKNLSGQHIGVAALMKMHTLRQEAIGPKIPVVDHILKERIERMGEKAVIYTSYLGAFKNFCKRYEKYGVCSISGRSSSDERVSDVKSFERDEGKRLFIVSSAGGESIDLTPAGSLIFVNKPLTYAYEKQVVDRLHRRGQDKEVSVYNLSTRDTIDERVEELVERKKGEFNRVIKENRGMARWFEEKESDNIKEVLERMLDEVE